MQILQRNSNTINIATFWENNQLKKYNFSPPYQRPDNVWTEEKKSFLIDSIMKNFPIPPIFLHQHIDDETGKTIYDVIDGKQRLNAIVDFIENRINLPEDFNGDNFGDSLLNGLKFSDLENPTLKNWKSNFWKYELSIEYVDTDQIDIVNNIFDRLNRNGEPLTAQELRNAKYNNSLIYKTVKLAIEVNFWKPLLSKLEQNRLEDHEFISELLFVILENQVFGSDNMNILDGLYEKYIIPENNQDVFDSAFKSFKAITEIIESFNLDYEKYKIYGVSHLYGIFCLAWVIYNRNESLENIPGKLDIFYKTLREKVDNEFTKEYQISMSAGTKYKGRRLRRINSLLSYLNLRNYES